MGVYDQAMNAMQGAGIELVYVNMSDVLALPGNQYSIDMFEEPREFARSGIVLDIYHCYVHASTVLTHRGYNINLYAAAAHF